MEPALGVAQVRVVACTEAEPAAADGIVVVAQAVACTEAAVEQVAVCIEVVAQAADAGIAAVVVQAVDADTAAVGAVAAPVVVPGTDLQGAEPGH